MTTYQDQPLSRRAIREREAAEAARAAETQNPTAASGEPEAPQPGIPPQSTPEPLSYVTQGRSPLPQYDTPVAQPSAAPVAPAQSPAGEASDDAGYRYRDFSPEGRRAARLNRPPAAAESADLDYRTQNREGTLPPAAPAPAAASAPPTFAAPADAAPLEGGLSRRELRAMREAEERGSAAPVGQAPAASAPPVVASSAPVAPAVEQPASAAPGAPAAAPDWLAAFAPPAAASPTTAAPAFDDILVGEVVESDADASGPVVVAENVQEVPPPLVEPVAPRTDAVASLEALFRANTGVTATPTPAEPTPAQQAPAEPTPAQQAPSAAPSYPPPAYAPPPVAPTAFTAPPAPAASAPPTYAPPRFVPPAAASAPPVVAPTPSAAPGYAPAAPAAGTPPGFATETPDAAAAAAAAAPGLASFVDSLQPPSPFDQTTVPAPGAATTASQPPVPGERPRNHWSRQAELDDEAQPATGSLTRDVGVGSATASALVLPEIPTHDFIVSPVTSTGDVLVTGSISLPASLASTGALPTQLDESDLDNLLDPGDHQVASTDSQPVRAIRAVSTHTSSREIIGSIKPKRGNRALTALIISAAGMAVVVVTLLVVALASGVLR